MKPIKILHTGDWHIREKDLDEIDKCLSFMVDYIHESGGVHMVVIAGDIFDSRMIKLDSGSARLAFRIVSELANMAPVAVLIGTPSHDGLAAELLANVPGGVHVSSYPEHIYHEGGTFQSELSGYPPDLLISMVPTPTKQYLQIDGDIESTDQAVGQAMNGLFAGFGAGSASFPDVPHILVGHFSVGGAFLSDTQQMIGRDIEVSRDQIALAQADVVCLGHIHKRQKIGDNIFYCGSAYRKDYGELDEKGFYIHAIGKGKCESKFIKVPTRKLVRFSRDLTRSDNPNFDIPITPAEFQSTEDGIVRIEIKAYQDEVARIDKERIRADLLAFGAKYVDFKITRVQRVNVRSQKLLSLSTLRDKIQERANILGQAIPDTILRKCDMIEANSHDEVLREVTQ